MGHNNIGSGKRKGGSILFIFADGFDQWLMILGLIGSIGSGMPIPAGYLFTSHLVNTIGSASTSSLDVFLQNINKYVLAYVYISCGSFVVNFLAGYCWTRTAERQATRMRARYLKAVMRQDVAYFDLHESTMSEVITTVSNDSSVIQDVLSEKVPNLLMNVSLFLASNAVAFAILWRLAIVTVPFLVLLVVPALFCGRKLIEIARKIQEEYNGAGKIVEQSISSVRTVYSFVGEKKSIAKFSTALEGSVKLGLRQGFVKGLAIGSNSIQFAIWAFLCYYSSRLVMYHGAKGGSVFAAGYAMGTGGFALGSAIINFKSLSEAYTAGKRMIEVIERIPKIDSDNMEGETLENVLGEVEFSHVEFAYPSRPETMIFKDFCLKIPSGKTLALVGGSGSGKSTVIALLQRFYDPIGGEIRLDGVAIDGLHLKWLRSQMGLVSQEPSLFATTIKENILFGKEDADMKEIIEAAKASNAHDFISKLPLGYETQVWEGGIQMSGGQKQRIGIARAIIKKPQILLLDEATSALDSESERIVQQALDKAAVGRTTIVIAHRLSTIHNAHTISVVQDGHVAELGSHDELISRPNGLYASLVHVHKTEKPNTHTQTSDNSALGRHVVSSSIVSIDSRMLSRSSSGHSARVHSFDMEDYDEIIEFKEMPKNNTDIQEVPSLRRLVAMNLPEWKQAVLGCVAAAMSGAVQPSYSAVMGSMVWVFFLTDHAEIKERTLNYSLFFLGLALFSFLVNICQHYNFAYMGENLTKRIREKMISKILSFEVGWFDQEENSTGAICSRLANEATVVRSLVGDRISLIVQTISAVIVSYTTGIAIAWRLALVMIAIQPLIIICHYIRKVLLQSMTQKALKSQEQSSKLAAEAVSNLRTITAFSSQTRILKMLEIAQQGPRRESAHQSWYAGFGLALSCSLVTFTMAFTFWYSGKLVADGLISSKALFVTLTVLLTTGQVIAEAGTMTSDLAKGFNAIASVFTVMDRHTQIEPEDPKGHRPEEIKGHVELCDVHFAYPARPDIVIFQSFSMKIEAGRSTALVGQSGSGKSTIIGLIERFYDPLKGVVKIDGRDIRCYNLKSLRKHIALVSQEPTLFTGTIKENMTYGASDEISETEIIDAAKAANAHDFIAGLKDGYGTFCGDKGVQLSGGQKQRIAIARAILKNPTILLLDEATSALDSQSENVVQEALEHLMVGRTSVVVAHRLSTIQNCNVIAVLEKGEVVEKGTHSSLLAKGPDGAYYALVSLQRTPTSTSDHRINTD